MGIGMASGDAGVCGTVRVWPCLSVPVCVVVVGGGGGLDGGEGGVGAGAGRGFAGGGGAAVGGAVLPRPAGQANDVRVPWPFRP